MHGKAGIQTDRELQRKLWKNKDGGLEPGGRGVLFFSPVSLPSVVSKTCTNALNAQ